MHKMYCKTIKISWVKIYFPLGKLHSKPWITSQTLGFRKFNFKQHEVWGKYNYIIWMFKEFQEYEPF